MAVSVLVVDDGHHGRSLAAVLRSLGLRAELAADAFGAMTHLDAKRSPAGPAAVVVCVGARTLTLEALCQRIKRKHAGVAIVLVAPPDRAVPDALLAAAAAVVRSAHVPDMAELVSGLLAGHLEPTSTTIDLVPSDEAALAPPPPAALPVPLRGPGAALLCALFARAAHGRLIVRHGAAAGSLDVRDGEPVFARLPTGDDGLHRRLVELRMLPAEARVAAVPDGQLLDTLVGQGLLVADDVRRFVRDLVRAQALLVIHERDLVATFVEGVLPLESTALVRVNPFGLVVEARRRAVAPEVLGVLAEELAPLRLRATGTLALAAQRIGPFVGGRDLHALLARHPTAAELAANLGLDMVAAALLLLALRDAGLVETEAQPGPPRARVPTAPFFPLHSAPPRSPRQLLGVGMAPDEDEIDAAWRARIADLEQRIAPDVEGAGSALAAARRQLDIAREALRLQLGFTTAVGRNSGNPFA